MHNPVVDLLPSGLLPLAIVLVGIFLIIETWWHGRAGSAAFGHGGRVLRAESPVGFWLMIGMKLMVGAFALWLGFHSM